MRLSPNTPYDRDIFSIKQLGENTLKIVYNSAVRVPGYECDKHISGYEPDKAYVDKCTVNEDKLSNNLSRAKTTVKELALCNPWDFWCTFTIDKEKYDRYNLDTYMRDFAKFINNYNSYKCPEEHKIKYLFVPEQHKDGAWHIHGFIKGIKPRDLYINNNGYLSWKQYDKKFGFMSMDKIKDQDKCSSYILKYMTKDQDKNVTDLNRHLYYSSQGLKRAKVLFRGHANYFGNWDWEHEDGYVKVKTLDTRKDNLNDYIEVYKYDNTRSI